MAGPVCGVDLGGTHMQFGIIDAARLEGADGDAAIIGRSRGKTRAEEGVDAVVTRLAQGVAAACTEAGIDLPAVEAVGIGAPGAIDPRTQRVLDAPNLGWRDVALHERLAAELERTGAGKVFVRVENDVNAAAWGEHRLGAGRGADDLIGVWVGTGIGGGLVLDGRLYRGGAGTAGEIGHVIVDPDLPPGRRHLEYWCSRKSVMRLIREAVAGGRASVITEIVPDLGQMNASHLAGAYQRGDDVVREIVDRAADLLGMVIANHVTVLSLPVVLLGGGMTEAVGTPYVERIAASLRAHVFPDALESVEVRPTELADNAGLLGAALVAVDHI